MVANFRLGLLSSILAVGVACAGPAKLTRLDKIKSFPTAQQLAASAVNSEVKSKGYKPAELFAEVVPENGGLLTFHLWSKANHSLLKHGKPVNPGGGLDVTVDPKSGKIIETLLWQ
jgi:hypothetical protein